MRRILIDNARRKKRLKRGGNQKRVNFNDADIATHDHSLDLLAIDEALSKLAKEDAVKADLVKLRYFAGLTLEQASSILGISKTTAKRHWAYARAWLYRKITAR